MRVLYELLASRCLALHVVRAYGRDNAGLEACTASAGLCHWGTPWRTMASGKSRGRLCRVEGVPSKDAHQTKRGRLCPSLALSPSRRSSCHCLRSLSVPLSESPLSQKQLYNPRWVKAVCIPNHILDSIMAYYAHCCRSAESQFMENLEKNSNCMYCQPLRFSPLFSQYLLQSTQVNSSD